MTWNGQSRRIGAAGLCHGPNRLRRSDLKSNVAVRRRCSQWDLLQSVPDALLKGSISDIEWEIESKGWILHKPHYFRNKILESALVSD
jgi:hypothetical protein